MYVRISGRVRLNAHSLNAQGGGGSNYIEVTKTKVTVKTDNGWAVVEVPAITGNMVKHWHFVGFVDYFRKTPFKDNLTERALRYNGTRFGQGETKAKKADGTEVELKDEGKIIKHLADADVHGFLAPKTGVRRVSLVKTSFVVPAEDFIREVEGERLINAVKHNRVDITEKGTIGSSEEGTAQMLFSREYATGLYGFSVVLDLGLVGVPQSNIAGGSAIPDNERKERIKSALLALIPMLSGYIGANLARSFPLMKVEEFIAVASAEPIPALVHGFYDDYVEASGAIVENARKLGFDIKAFAYNTKFVESANEVSSVEELVGKLLETLEYSSGGSS
ncbi:type I-A CRISPR-associated protein Cas7/Csa2 [Thermococcus gammatolerans]|uniref:CRISPR-associated autoregulator, DevR family n=1 Tax=Thermococcus gammatolerans (strain DSM 15229 / JCM 11827 / EJ3) TaxID=593117 RepID=C5A6D2_THEGJ|nr:type I-A CRISPR-associated protein Cas7/Csa2 [Thermococcus gammatolerans]ACS33794.1 CRISPR-associated autoregulator, DevR family [Thermococcus gammatolerans EJ3]